MVGIIGDEAGERLSRQAVRLLSPVLGALTVGRIALWPYAKRTDPFPASW